MPMENYRIIEGFPDYEISRCGEIRRLTRRKGFPVLRVLRWDYGGWGSYPRVHLSRNGKQKVVFVHRLVANAFLGPCPLGREVNHRDGNKQNPCDDNLEYVTHTENSLHAFRSGLRVPTTAKLTADNVQEIRNANPKTLRECEALAGKFGVLRLCVWRVVRGVTWNNVHADG